MDLSQKTEVKINFMPFVERFINNQDINYNSKLTYESAIKLFVKWFEDQTDITPTRESILKYKNNLDTKGLRSSTRATYIAVLRRFFEWCSNENIHPNVAFGIKGTRRKTELHAKDSLSLVQLREMFGVINHVDLQGKRDYAIVNLLVRTGLRLIEIIRANYDDLVPKENGAVLWIQGKGRDDKDDYVILTQDALSPLLQYLKERGSVLNKQPLFASVSDRNFGGRLTTYSVSRLIKKYLKKANLDSPRLTAHSLRHTFGVLAIKAGSSLHEVQLSMRHKSPETTEIYLADIHNQIRMQGLPEKRLSELLK